MSLRISLCTTIAKDCSTITISDATGYYDVVTNPYGYDITGVDNFDPNDIDLTTGKLIFRLSDGTETTLDLVAGDFNVDNIGTTGLINKEVTFADLDLSGIESDDVLRITYTYNDTDGNKYSKTIYTLKDCIARCNLNDMLLDIDSCENCKDATTNKKINDTMMAKIILEGAKYKLACNDVTGAKRALDYVNDLTSDHNCDSCN